MAISTQNNNGALSPTKAYYEKVLLKRLIAKTVYHNLTYKRTLKNNAGRSYTFTIGGIQPTNTLSLPGGVPVTPADTTASNVEITLQEYGNVFAVGSFLGFTSVVDSFKFLMEQVTQAGAFAIDGLVRNAVYNTCTSFGVNQFAANDAASIAAIGAADVLSLTDVRAAHFKLEQNNVPTYRDEKYVGVISTGQKYDLTSQTGAGQFLDLAKQSPTSLKEIGKSVRFPDDAEVSPVGEYAGMVLFSTSLNPVVSNGTVNVHYSAFWGDESLASVELDGEKFKIFTKSADKGTYDVIEMINMAAGYRMGFGAQVIQTSATDPYQQRVISYASASSLF